MVCRLRAVFGVIGVIAVVAPALACGPQAVDEVAQTGGDTAASEEDPGTGGTGPSLPPALSSGGSSSGGESSSSAGSSQTSCESRGRMAPCDVDQAVAIGIPEALQLAFVADLNRDGVGDLGLVDEAGALVPWLGPLRGPFAPRPRVAPPEGTGEVEWAPGAFDGDAAVDLVALRARATPGRRTTSVVCHAGLGDGTFRILTEQQSAAPFDRPFAVGDVDDDGDDDLVLGDAFWVLTSDGTGAFGDRPIVHEPHLLLGMYTSSVALADFDGDGHRDLLLANGEIALGAGDSTLEFVVWFGDGRGGFTRLESQPIASEPGSSAVGGTIVAGAWTPGRAGLQVAVGHDEGVVVFGGTKAPAAWSREVLAVGRGGPLAAGDLDGDGVPDLAVAYEDGTVALFESTSGRWSSARIGNVGGPRPTELAAADFDGDGTVDLLAWTGRRELRLLRGGFRGP